MPMLVRLSESASSGSPFNVVPTFDLMIEGLSRDNARTLTRSVEELILGIPAIPSISADLPRSNPLAELDEYVQKMLTGVVLGYFRMTRNKIACIKMLRTLYPGTGLKDSKDFTDFAASCSVGVDSQSISSTSITDFDPSLRPHWIKF